MMQRKTKMIAATAAVGLLTLGGLAGLASADMGDGQGMMGGMGGMAGGCHGGMGRGHGMMGQQMMERYDADKDGKLTQTEIDQNRQQWLAEFDADKNGTLSLDEFKQLWLKGRNQMMVREFQFFDKDGNAQVTLEEYQAPLANVVTERDTNNDGSLGPDDRRMMGQHQGEGRSWRHGMGHGFGAGAGSDGDNGEETEPDGEQPSSSTPSTP